MADHRYLEPKTITSLGRPVTNRLATDSSAGRLATAAWLSACGLRPRASWDIEIGLGIARKRATLEFDPKRDTRFQLHLHADEWGFRFCHAGRESWIRITDLPSVHGSDHFELVATTPPLKNVRALVRALEADHGLTWQRPHASVLSTIPDAEPAIRAWLQTL